MREPFRKRAAAPVAGRFATQRAIGDFVLANEELGTIGGETVFAPSSGVLSGLAARGSRMPEGAATVEVDARGQPTHCFGLPAWCDALARDVIHQVTSWLPHGTAGVARGGSGPCVGRSSRRLAPDTFESGPSLVDSEPLHP